MTTGIVLALLAGICTAGASVAQRAAAATAPVDVHFSVRLVAYLVRRPVWFLGIACMIAGFGFQLAALHFGDLSLVQPVIASELVLVFAYLAVRHRGRVKARDWAAAGGMAAALGGFLYLASPHGGSASRPDQAMWILAGAATGAACAAAAGLSVVRLRGEGPISPARKAAMLAIAGGTGWGFVAAVIKELSAHVALGPYAVFTNWSPYVLLGAGALTMFVVSNAFQAGPLAASQPALTVTEPVVAVVLGSVLFGEHVRHGPLELAGEIALAVVLLASVVVLSRSPLMGETPFGDDRRSQVEAEDPARGAGPGAGDFATSTVPDRR